MVIINLDKKLKDLEQSFNEHDNKAELAEKLTKLEERLDKLEDDVRKKRPKGVKRSEDKDYWKLIEERRKIGAFEVKMGLYSSSDKGLYPTETERLRTR